MNIPRWEFRQSFDCARNHAMFTISKAVSSLEEVKIVGALFKNHEAHDNQKSEAMLNAYSALFRDSYLHSVWSLKVPFTKVTN